MKKPSIVQKMKVNKLTIFGAVAFFAATGLFFLMLSRAATTGPNLGFYMTSTNVSPAVGTQFDVKLYANTGTLTVKSIAAEINYNAAQVRPDIVASAPKANPLASPPVDGFDETLACGPANGCRSDTGTVVVALTNTGSSRRSGDGIYLGTIRFTALKAGATGIVYNASIDHSSFLNPDGSTFDSDGRLVTKGPIQTALDGRLVQNIAISAVSGSNTAPPSSGGSGSGGNAGVKSGGGGSVPAGSGTANNNSGGSGVPGSSGTVVDPGLLAPQDIPTDLAQDNSQSTPLSADNSEAATSPKKKTVSKQTLVAASAGLAALALGTLTFLFGTPVRTAFMDFGHLFHSRAGLSGDAVTGLANNSAHANSIDVDTLNSIPSVQPSAPGEVISPENGGASIKKDN